MHWLFLLFTTVAGEMSPRIVGGNIADIRDWPFMTFIAVFGEDTASTCGGSLISSQTVLTAAHCLDDVTDSKKDFLLYNFTILMGHSKFSKATLMRTVHDYQTHQNYDPTGTVSDIGVMFLERPVDFSKTVKKVILMRLIDSKEDKELEVAGWGAWTDRDNEAFGISPVLKSLRQPLFPHHICSKLLDDEDDMKGVLCAGKINASEFAYSGDSGGPIVKSGIHMQVGLVSFRIENFGLTVYTSIPYYYKWIEQTQVQLYRKHCMD